ncbi:hypothetical protein HPP92_012752 [Vanilla planifolia]|uniref:Receptor-like serine/threonine-protein kinase n=1 Tax=Vanilla planifolia TaxID=51239 RepID=A0A835QUC3_VANPL|nr:hypothetical protein HPP92_012752 [Vanilla planifolia]
MASVLCLLLLQLLPLFRPRRRASASFLFTEFLYPNFSASSVNYLDRGGFFLTSASSTFSASLSSDSPQSPFVFSIIHAPTTTVVWSANSASPAPYTAALSLSSSGLSITFSNGSVLWSTPHLARPAKALCLLDSGNLLLLDSVNVSLWQSFEHPIDTLLFSQRLPSGGSLSTTAGDYRLLVTVADAILLWSTGGDQQFWSFAGDPRSVKDSNAAISYMSANDSGLYLFAAGDRVVYTISLPTAKIRIMRLESGGLFRVLDYSGTGSSLNEVLKAPTGDCDLPSSCKQLEVCTTQGQGATCNCPAGFAASRGIGCTPTDGSTIASATSCVSDGSYRSLGSGIGYIVNKFTNPARSGGDLSSCRQLCTANCSCIGFFYKNSSRSCFLIKKQIGSLASTSNGGAFDSGIGYIKILSSPPSPSTESSGGSSSPHLLPIILPSISVFLLVIVLFAGIRWLHRRRIGQERRSRSPLSPVNEIHRLRKPSHFGDSDDFKSDSDSEEISIPGLPTRFAFSDLVVATENFSTKIGSGGFGEVFKGRLPDKSLVAVKRITASFGGGMHGKKEFCTEIAVIGNIHHVNLVRLRGFCAEGRRRLLVYEYMNRGSLERSLFPIPGREDPPLLEWPERMAIAVGAARGLAYLHSGCDQKIVHCDVKPENILLDDRGGVKISDFGLAKLISKDQSGFFTTMRGTRGYLAPEWITNSAISDRTDVYSYGMVLLEIIRGRKNRSTGVGGEGSSSSSSGGVDLGYFPMIALEMHEQGRYVELADPRLERRVNEDEVRRAVRVALCCLHEDPSIRPTMTGVAAMLDGTAEVAQPRSELLGFLRLYGRGYVDSTGSSGGGWVAGTGTTTNSSVVSYSFMISQELSGPR